MQKEKELEGLATISTIAELETPSQASISIITPPKASFFTWIHLGSS